MSSHPRRFWQLGTTVFAATAAVPPAPTTLKALMWRGYGSTCNHLASNTQIYLRNLKNGGEVFLIGTAHVSKQSADEVRDMIRMVRPDTVFVELCHERADAMRRQTASSSDSKVASDFIREIVKTMGQGGPLAETFVKTAGSAYNKFFKIFGMEMGQEFRVAMEEADRLGARVVYGDRPQQETIKGVVKGIDVAKILQMAMGGTHGHSVDPELEKLQREAGSLEELVEAMKTRSAARSLVQQMDQNFPEICQALIHERDEIMARALASEPGRVVAVVGLGHIDGIEKRWEALTLPRSIQ